MKNICYLMMLLFTVILTSCSSEIEEFDSNSYNDGRTLTVSASMPCTGTRISTDDLQNIVWEADDEIYAVGVSVGPDGNTITEGVTTLKIVSQPGSKKATFKGQPVANATTYYLYYTKKYTADQLLNNFDNTFGKVNFDCLNQKQHMINSTSHIKNEILLASGEYKNQKEVLLNHQNNILRINLKNMPGGLKNAASCKLDFSFDKNSIKASTTLASKMSDAADNYIYLVFNRVLLPKNSEVKLVFDVNGTQYIARGTTSSEAIDMLKGGKIYTMTVDNHSTETSRAVVWEMDYDGIEQYPQIDLTKCIQFKINGEAPKVIGDYVYQGAVKGTPYKAYSIPAGPNQNLNKNISDRAFLKNSIITSVIIPAGVENIGSNAFGACRNLESVKFAPDSKLKTLRPGCFTGCFSLSDIELPNSLEFMGKGTFAECDALKTLTIPAGISIFEKGGALSDLTTLTTLIFKKPIDSDETFIIGLKELFGEQKIMDKCDLILDKSWEYYVKTTWGPDKNLFYGVTYKSIAFQDFSKQK